MTAILNLHPIPLSVARSCDECPRAAAFYDAADDHYLCKQHTLRELERITERVKEWKRG